MGTVLELVATVKPFLKSAETLRAFVRDEMAELLEKLGDIQYQAAIGALNDAKKSSQPSREIEMAVTHLRGAYQTFYSIIPKDTFFSGLKEAIALGVMGPFYTPKTITGNKKACEAAIMIAICYRDFKEDTLMEEYINRARKHYQKYVKASEEYEHDLNIATITSRGIPMSSREDKALERKQLMALLEGIKRLK